MNRFVARLEAYFLFLLIAPVWPGPAIAQDAKAIYERSAPSVVALVMTDRTGQPLSLGSGFVIRNELVVTNFHVIRGAAGGSAKIAGSKSTLVIQGVVAKDPERDLAILKVSGLTAPPLTLASRKEPAVGESIFAIGNPQGLEGTLSQGIVSGIRTVGDTALIQITAAISPGSSGGPVIGASGGVVGVAVATLRTGQNLNFAVAAKHVELLLARAGAVETLATAANAKPNSKESPASVIGGPGIEKVVPTNIQCTRDYGVGSWECNFSVKNNLEIPIHAVRYLAILRDRSGQPIDAREGKVAQYSSIIRPGLALRTGIIDGEFKIEDATKRLVSKIEVRILSFEPAQ